MRPSGALLKKRPLARYLIAGSEARKAIAARAQLLRSQWEIEPMAQPAILSPLRANSSRLLR